MAEGGKGNCKVHTTDRIDAMVAKTDGVRLSYKALIARAKAAKRTCSSAW
jgi:hypothetical protein